MQAKVLMQLILTPGAGTTVVRAYLKRRRPYATVRCQFVLVRKSFMCRSIKTLHNFEPPATEEEVRASALQFVRKLAGFTRPSKVNEAAFNHAVDHVAQAAHELLHALVTNAPKRDRAAEAAKAKARAADLYRTASTGSA
jgi:hypothetical protein